MTISIQGSAAALAQLDTLPNQTAPTLDAGANALLNADSQSQTSNDPGASILDVSGGAAAAALNGLTGGFATSVSAIDAATSAGSTIEGLLSRMRQDALSAADPSLGDDSRAALDTGFKADLAQVQSAVSGASVDGLNLIDGSSPQVSGATLSGINLSLGGPVIGVGADASLTDPTTAGGVADQLASAIDNLGQAMSRISAQGQAIQGHLTLVAQAGLGLTGGVDTGLDADGARLAALQVQQTLAGGAGGIANQGPQAILSLFR